MDTKSFITLGSGPSDTKQFAEYNYSAMWDNLLRIVNFQNFITVKNYSENESKIKIKPWTDFICNINGRVKALIPIITKCRVIFGVALLFFRALDQCSIFSM